MNGIYTTKEGQRLVEEQYRKFLKYWPAANRQFPVSTRQGDTFVITCGEESGPPTLLLQGAQRSRLFAIDMIGEPGLSVPSRPPLASEAYALWLDDVMSGLGLERASLVGISLGGWLAL